MWYQCNESSFCWRCSFKAWFGRDKQIMGLPYIESYYTIQYYDFFSCIIYFSVWQKCQHAAYIIFLDRNYFPFTHDILYNLFISFEVAEMHPQNASSNTCTHVCFSSIVIALRVFVTLLNIFFILKLFQMYCRSASNESQALTVKNVLRNTL